ncbi:MAG: retropepsin-like domain-containing protein [Anaerolineales bacterium]|nr:retropepsin-like domain-containing protein [Anaerolineales bacterium]
MIRKILIRQRPATGACLSNIPMLIDTGADATLIPQESVEQLEIEVEEDSLFEVQGFDGEIKWIKMAKLELVFLKKKFTGQFLLIDQPMGILGRNILNSVSITFNGPRNKWDESKR